MRKCMVSKFIYRAPGSPTSSAWEEAGEAVFHGFGADYEEFETGPGNFSAAIVEFPNGQVDLVRADKIRFLDGVGSK